MSVYSDCFVDIQKTMILIGLQPVKMIMS